MKLSWLTLVGALLSHLTLTPLGNAQTRSEEKIIDLAKLTAGGTGCPASAEPLRVKYSEKTGRLLVYFSRDEMKVELTDSAIERKSCALALPVRLPPGKGILLGKPSVFGRVDLAQKASAEVRSEVFVPGGGKGPSVTKSLGGEEKADRSFYAFEGETIEVSCGAETILRANVSIVGRMPLHGEGGSIEVEGVGLTARIVECPGRSE